ncbi:Zn-dependent protease [Thalassoporum mexicanum PCC 7367]|uniref:TldD/PmbA family protein n=1 Tax=Thalassoporum mexicanum TaxID=3457544 RepID=UPI00029FEEE7|nr:metallopeptidase TldD-related protein [Pseudanabaena sp. PCC 7367]AFY69581.1 Zn-dependent protease [Pseudanabaena sp. PCC 7367]
MASTTVSDRPEYISATAQLAQLEASFNQVVDALLNQLQAPEQITISLQCERSQFTRFNRARVRQTGLVDDGTLSVNLICDHREAYAEFVFTGESAIDVAIALQNLDYLRQEVAQLPENPYTVAPSGEASSRAVYVGNLLEPATAIEAILAPIQQIDYVGLYSAGVVIRASANSSGQRHWFATDSFIVDYSMFASVSSSSGQSDRAIKGSYAGRDWQQSQYVAQVTQSQQQLQVLQRPAHQVDRGTYRTYLAPAAMAEIAYFLAWVVGEAGLQQGSSALIKLWQKEQRLSPLFTLQENFANGMVPQFNSLGEIAPEQLPIIANGKLVNTLVSARSAAEYGKPANGADRGEGMRSPEILPGNLPREQILAALDTGLYLSNLHYLNWSDRPGGRITGMTRYACFWVEGGEIIAPIENLRFDHSIYSFLGENLAALTNFSEFQPDTGTYYSRSLGGVLTPGLLAKEFTFTL